MSEITNDNVTTTVVLTLEAMISYMQSKLPGVSFVYDDNLGYESGMMELRSANELRDKFKHTLPAFFFKRSVLRPAEEGQGRRSVVNRVCVDDESNPNPTSEAIYRTIHGTYDIEFNYVTTKMSELENFEVAWLSEGGIPQLKDLKITVPSLGDIPYFVKYNLLDEKVINSEGNYYKVLFGTMNVRGYFFVFEGNSSIIREIQGRIMTFKQEVLGEITLT
jgi:hypothetical protein